MAVEFAKRMKVRLTLTEEMLGTASGDPELYATYIASKAPDADKREQEIEDFDPDAQFDKAMTGFPRDENGQPFVYDYQIRGFFKEAASFLRKLPNSASKDLKAFKKQIDGLIMVEPRKIPLNFKGFPGQCQRPLRASTPPGERIALAVSESVPVGTTLEFDICMFDAKDEERVREWLDYGKYHGLGQWRSSGKGSYLWEELDENGKAIGGNYAENK